MDPLGFGKIIADNWGIVKMSPGVFAAVLGFGFLVGSAVQRAFLNERLTRQQIRIADLQSVLDGKFPASFLPHPERKRSKKMSFGLILIFVGIGAALLGALLVSSDLPAIQRATGDRSGAVAKTTPADNPYIRWNKSPEFGSSMDASNILSVTQMGQTGVSDAEKEFELQDAYVISKITGARMPILVATYSGMIPPNQSNPIPPKASITLRAEIEPRIEERTFLRDWGSYDLVYKIDGTEFRKTITKPEIVSAFEEWRAQMDMATGAERGPRVTKRN